MRAQLSEFSFSDEENQKIKNAYTSSKPWNADNIDEIKRKIKNFHLHINHNLCCYCQRSLRDEFQMVIDVEHILPSSLYKQFTFEIWNTSASCKRCNMRIKKDRVDFINTENKNFLQSAHYKFAHPNFDPPFEHLKIQSIQDGPDMFVQYRLITNDKGKYTYDYFELQKIEVFYLNKAQGIVSPPIDDDISILIDKISDINHEFSE